VAFLDNILQKPSYGYVDHEGNLVKPGIGELFKEFFASINPTTRRQRWISFWNWFTTLVLTIPFFVFFIFFFDWKLMFLGLVYSMVVLGTFGTVWYHRYSTHRAFKFRNGIWRFFVRNAVVRIIPEEIYVVSHHVHHRMSERPGDPYNVNGGWLYCFLADANHQLLSDSLSESEYKRVSGLLTHTGMHVNSYAQYKRWGSVAHPALTVLHYVLNWGFWYGVFFLIGGHALATALFGFSAVWAFGVRTFNYDGHGRGKDKRKAGIDFNGQDFSINQVWPGYVAGEWHNNHHLYPNSARSGFLPYQLDLAWIFIRGLSLIGGVAWYRDSKSEFLEKHFYPYKRKKGFAT
jgi:sn-1 stearoyl-lipid 9-desaturase